MNKTALMTAAGESFTKLTTACNNMDEAQFFKNPDARWSAAENVQHLILSTNMTTLAYRLPRFIVRIIGGKPNRASRSFEELKEKYYKKLAAGGRASSPFVPKPIEIKYGRQKLMDNWSKATNDYLNALAKNRTEQDLDNYLAKHPLLGRITLRELCYFTIFHTEHHLQAIENIA